MTDWYYYSTLSSEDKAVYRRIYDGITKREASIGPLREQQVSVIELVRLVGLDNPEIFYVDFDSIHYSNSLLGTRILPTYWYTAAEIAELNEKIRIVTQKMLKRIDVTNDYTKVVSVHDLLAENVTYNLDAIDETRRLQPRANSIAGVLFYKTAVCEGIAKAVKLLLNAVGVKCIVALGDDKKHSICHAWNIVKIDGEPYHVDVTWDISLRAADVCRDYLNLTDAEIAKDHQMEYTYPTCRATSANYFIRNGWTVQSMAEARRLFAKEWLLRKKQICVKFAFCNEATFVPTVNEFLSFVGSHALGEKYGVVLNEDQRILTLFKP